MVLGPITEWVDFEIYWKIPRRFNFSPKTEKITTFLEIVVGLAKYTLTAPKLALLGSQTSIVVAKCTLKNEKSSPYRRSSKNENKSASGQQHLWVSVWSWILEYYKIIVWLKYWTILFILSINGKYRRLDNDQCSSTTWDLFRTMELTNPSVLMCGLVDLIRF